MISLPLSGAQKCAVLLLLLEESAAAGLLRGLSPADVDAVGDAMLSVAEIDPRAIDAVLDDFLGRHAEVAALGQDGAQVRSVMVQAFDPPAAARVLGRLGPPVTQPRFAALAWAEPATIAALLAAEHPQAGAAILAHLPPETGAAVLALLPPELGSTLIVRVARLGPLAPGLLSELEADVETQLAALAAAPTPPPCGGAQFAARLLGGVADAAALLASVRGHDAELGGTLADLRFVFADLARLDARGLQAVVREVEPAVLTVALKGADGTTRAAVFGAMSQRAAAGIEDDLASLGRLKREEVDAAQGAVAAVARHLADEGVLVLPGSGDNYV